MLKQTDHGVFLWVKIIPKANKNEIVGGEGDRLKIRLAAIPMKGQANVALIQFLSQILGISKSQITIVQGETSRLKKVLIKELSIEQIERRLNMN